MHPNHPKSKNQLLDWLNHYISNYYQTYSQNIQQVHSYLKRPISKIQQLGNGIAYLLMLHSLDKTSVPLNKIQFKTKNQYDNLTNLKLLDIGLGKAKIKKSIDISKLAKMKVQDNLEMLQWFEKYIQQRTRQLNKQESIRVNQNTVSSQNEINLSNQKSQQIYKQTNQSSYNNSESLMKLAVSSHLHKKSDFATKPIKLIKEPNPQQLRKKLQMNLHKKIIVSKSNSLKSFQQNQQIHNDENIINTATFGINYNENKDRQVKKIGQTLSHQSRKREIQDDYEGQLKKVTAQFKDHKIIDQIVDIIYIKDQQKDVGSDGKLAKIQQILFKNGYGGKKTGMSNVKSNKKQQLIKKENQMTAEQQTGNTQQNNQQNAEKQQQKLVDQSKIDRSAVSNRKQNNYQKYILRQSLKSAILSDHKSRTKPVQQISPQDYALLETPIGDNENLLEMSEDQKKILSKRRSSLKKEDLLYLQLEGQHMKLLEGGKQNNVLFENNDINIL